MTKGTAGAVRCLLGSAYWEMTLEGPSHAFHNALYFSDCLHISSPPTPPIREGDRVHMGSH